MNILLTGATSFVGRHVARALLDAGHEVTGTSRDRSRAFRRYPRMGWIKADFGADREPGDWERRLTHRDEVVINAPGMLHERPGASYEAVYFETPRALFRACASRGIRRVVHISVPGRGAGAERPCADAELRLERFLATLDIDWVVVRPSLVCGEDGRLQLASVDDLAAAIVRLVAPDAPSRVVLEPLRGGARERNVAASLRGCDPLPLMAAQRVTRAGIRGLEAKL